MLDLDKWKRIEIETTQHCVENKSQEDSHVFIERKMLQMVGHTDKSGVKIFLAKYYAIRYAPIVIPLFTRTKY